MKLLPIIICLALSAFGQTYFGDERSVIGNDYANGGYVFFNNTANQIFTCPGTGDYNITALQAQVRSGGVGGGTFRMAVTSTDLATVYATGTAVDVPSDWSTYDWRGGTATITQSATLTGGSDYLILIFFSANDVYIGTTSNDINFMSYISGLTASNCFDVPFSAGTGYTKTFAIRVGVEAASSCTPLTFSTGLSAQTDTTYDTIPLELPGLDGTCTGTKAYHFLSWAGGGRFATAGPYDSVYLYLNHIFAEPCSIEVNLDAVPQDTLIFGVTSAWQHSRIDSVITAGSVRIPNLTEIPAGETFGIAGFFGGRYFKTWTVPDYLTKVDSSDGKLFMKFNTIGVDSIGLKFAPSYTDTHSVAYSSDSVVYSGSSSLTYTIADTSLYYGALSGGVVTVTPLTTFTAGQTVTVAIDTTGHYLSRIDSVIWVGAVSGETKISSAPWTITSDENIYNISVYVSTSATIAQITTDPVNTVCSLSHACTLFVAATGTEPLYFAWQCSTAGVVSLVAFPDEDADSLIFTPILADSGKYYRSIVGNTFGDDSSAWARLDVVYKPMKINSIRPYKWYRGYPVSFWGSYTAPQSTGKIYMGTTPLAAIDSLTVAQLWASDQIIDTLPLLPITTGKRYFWIKNSLGIVSNIDSCFIYNPKKTP
jgi:hypothetical protein